MIYHAMTADYYCISITKKSDTSITDLSCYVSDCTVSVSPRRVIRLSVIYHAMSLTTVNITKKSDRSITVIDHAMSLTTVSVSPRRVICLSLIYHAVSLTTVSVSPRRLIRLSQ